MSYDMNNTAKSWKGAPATNLLTNPNSAINVNSTDVPAGIPVPGYSSYSSGYAVAFWSPVSTAATGVTFTYSMYMRSPGGVSTYLMYVYTGTGSDGGWNYAGSGSLTDTWARYTYTTGSWTGTVTNVCVYRYNQTGTIEIAAPQFEVSSFATPFVIGTRSNTQAITDQTGNNTLTANSLTYTNSNTFSFDGSFSYLQATNNCGITGDITLSAWIKPNRSGQTGPHSTVICTDVNYPYGAKLMNYKNSARYGIWLGWAGAGNTNYEAFVGVDINDNTNKMLTASWSQSTGVAKIYLNGVLQSTQSTGITSPVALADGKITVGTDYNSISSGSNNKYLGSIYNASIYNRVLSDTEITQNFNSMRGRYGI